VNPDGDCVGSCLATYNYIKENYPDIQIDVYLDPIPNIFKFLKSSDEIKAPGTEKKEYDLFLAQDCGDAARLGAAEHYFHEAKKTVCIDHHKSNGAFADINYIYPEASSTSELIYDLIEDEKISKAVAECIYLGIVHDTGVFQYSCTSSKTMNIAGRLMDKGIDFTRIINDTFFEKTYEQTRIMAAALLKSQRFLDETCIFSFITREEMEEYHVLPKHLEGIVSQMRAVKGVDTAVFLYQNGENSYKVSMRSSNLVDVAEIAVGFGGGGHARAAGATMEGDARQIRDLILEKIRQQLEKDHV
ncbi:MAG TPA: bifunctional oligoribonuclease/PAP phosphatase NrnA, partial [Candidatus Eubacterium avistercoris]|nr:bifunctional oligoribonuclease/PAP phosphatase NrnA [Candidatus Eubacterium avistercoris]